MYNYYFSPELSQVVSLSESTTAVTDMISEDSSVLGYDAV
jgi:hypothetical protein